MKPMLTKAAQHPLYYYRSGRRIEGPHPELLGGVTGLRGDASELWGDASELWGDVTGLRGNVTGIWGDVTDLRGNVTGLRGDATGLRGDLDACEITDAERKHGIDVATLVRSEP